MDIFDFGTLAGWPAWSIAATTATVLLALLFVGAPLWAFALVAAAMLWTFGAAWWLAVLVAAPLLVLLLPPLRRALLGDRILHVLRSAGFLPTISDTVRTTSAPIATENGRLGCSGFGSRVGVAPGTDGTAGPVHWRPSKYRNPPVYGSGYQPAGAVAGGGRAVTVA